MQSQSVFQCGGYTLNMPDWATMNFFCGRIVDRMLREYSKTGGLIPYDPGFVYLIKAEGSGYYKIGMSKTPSKRISQISPKMPFETRVIKIWRSYFMKHAEKMLHREHDDCRANGEWFELKGSLKELLSPESANRILYSYSDVWMDIFWGDSSSKDDRTEYRYWVDIFKDLNPGVTPPIDAILDPGIVEVDPLLGANASVGLIDWYMTEIDKQINAKDQRKNQLRDRWRRAS